MDMTYFNAPYDKVIDFLKNLSEEDLATLYDYYNIESADMEKLADIISDNDLESLGYVYNEDNKYGISKYSDVDDIVKYLTEEVDDYILEDLYTQYDCKDPVDLAIALTDDELYNLGYGDDSYRGDNNTSDIYYINSDYNEDLDYLEDIPNDINFIYLGKDGEDDLYITDNEESFERFKESLDTNLVQCCEALGTEDVFEPTGPDSLLSYAFTVKPTMSWEQVPEEVVINNSLNTAIFDEEHKMLPEIKQQIVDYVNGFAEKMSNKGVDINYSDITLVGSNAGYIYTPESDIDIHLISSDQINLEDAENLFKEFDLYEDENPLIINGAKVELGIEDNYDIIMNNKDTRRYSLVTDEWVNDSDKFEQFKPEDINKVEGYEEVVDEYTNKINDVVDSDNYEQALNLKQEIRINRSNDLANIGSLSMGNVVFKELRNNGSYGKLRDYITSKEIVGDMTE